MHFVVVHQEMYMGSIENILHGTINRPVGSTKEITMSPTGDKTKDNRIVVYVQVVHCEAKRAARMINCQLISDLFKECINLVDCCASFSLRP